MDINHILEVPAEESDRHTLEEATKLWRSYRDQRLEADRRAAELKKTEEALKSWVISVFIKQKQEGVVFDGRCIGLVEDEVPTVADRVAFKEYIMDHDALDLLQFRTANTAILERMGAGIKIPGVEMQPIYKLYDRKV